MKSAARLGDRAGLMASTLRGRTDTRGRTRWGPYAAPMSTSTSAPPRGWRIGSLVGIPVHLGRSWLVIAAVITALFGPVASRLGGEAPAVGYAVAFGFAVLLLVSVLVHEAAHALVARSCGYRVSRIVADFWGGHTAYDGARATPGNAALVAVSGPLANAGLAGIGWLGLQFLQPGMPWLLLTAFTAANGFVAVFNLLPGLPLDGGFLVDSLVWKVSGSRGLGTLVAGWSGRALVLGLAWWVIGRPLLAGGVPSVSTVLWSVLIASFLWAGASNAVRVGRARRSFEVGRVGGVCRPVGLVDEGASLDSVPWAEQALWMVTGRDGVPTGMVDPAALSRVDRTRAGDTRVGSVTTRQPPGWVVTASAQDPLTEVVQAMQTHQAPLIAVRGPGGDVLGVVSAHDL